MQARRAGNTTGAIGTANGDVTPEGLVTLQPSSGASNQIGSPSPSDVLTSFPDLPPSTIPEQVPVFTPTYSPESLQGGEGFGGGSGSSSPMPTTSTSSIGGGDVNGGGSSLVPTIVGATVTELKEVVLGRAEAEVLVPCLRVPHQKIIMAQLSALRLQVNILRFQQLWMEAVVVETRTPRFPLWRLGVKQVVAWGLHRAHHRVVCRQ